MSKLPVFSSSQRKTDRQTGRQTDRQRQRQRWGGGGKRERQREGRRERERWDGGGGVGDHDSQSGYIYIATHKTEKPASP